jgi:hypothetical protein
MMYHSYDQRTHRNSRDIAITVRRRLSRDPANFDAGQARAPTPTQPSRRWWIAWWTTIRGKRP